MKRQAPPLAVAVAAALAVAAGLATPGRADTIGAKRAQAEQVLAQLRRLDASAQRANTRYYVATQRLQRLEHELRVNRQALAVARVNFKIAQQTLAKRLVQIYTTRDAESTLGVILGAQSLDDLVNRIETVKSVSKQDSAVIAQVAGFQHQIVHRRVFLRHAHVLQKTLVRERRDAKARIDAEVSREQRLYDSVKSQIDQLVAQEHDRQLAAARLAAIRAQAQSQVDVPGFGVSASAGTATVAPPARYGDVVSIAMRYLGTPYVWGGASPSGFDCSGLVMYVYAQVGVSLPHYTGAQWQYGVPVSRDQLEPGDLVFFDGLGHVGIYIGGGQFIHAPQTGDVVKISSLNDGWYASTYDGARRITG